MCFKWHYIFMDNFFILCTSLLIHPFEEERDHREKPELWLRRLTLMSVPMNFTSLIFELWTLSMFFLWKPTFPCWCAFPVFPLSVPTPRLGTPSSDGFTEGPVNRAITTPAPSATACQRPTSGRRSHAVPFLLSFLFIPQSSFHAWGHLTWGHPLFSNGLQGTLKFASCH